MQPLEFSLQTIERFNKVGVGQKKLALTLKLAAYNQQPHVRRDVLLPEDCVLPFAVGKR